RLSDRRERTLLLLRVTAGAAGIGPRDSQGTGARHVEGQSALTTSSLYLTTHNPDTDPLSYSHTHTKDSQGHGSQKPSADAFLQLTEEDRPRLRRHVLSSEFSACQNTKHTANGATENKSPQRSSPKSQSTPQRWSRPEIPISSGLSRQEAEHHTQREQLAEPNVTSDLNKRLCVKRGKRETQSVS
ncbi:hypothetical protein KUCAC02_033213, partial [Chaenocephalus aceratus]